MASSDIGRPLTTLGSSDCRNRITSTPPAMRIDNSRAAENRRKYRNYGHLRGRSLAAAKIAHDNSSSSQTLIYSCVASNLPPSEGKNASFFFCSYKKSYISYTTGQLRRRLADAQETLPPLIWSTAPFRASGRGWRGETGLSSWASPGSQAQCVGGRDRWPQGQCLGAISACYPDGPDSLRPS